MTMLVGIIVVLAVIGLVLAANRFGVDSRSSDSRLARADWPGVRHCG